MDSRLTRKGPRLFLAAVSVLCTLVLLELGLRLFRPITYMDPHVLPPKTSPIHRASSIPGLAFELVPNSTAVLDGVVLKTNSYGMRGDEPKLNQSETLRRIGVLGDSYTFGIGMPTDQIYPHLMKTLLNESVAKGGEEYDVLNFGVVSYCSRDEALVLKYKALKWNPKVVIIGYVLNDPDCDPELQPIQGYFVKPQWWQHSHLLRLLAQIKYKWDLKRLGNGDWFRYWHAERGEKWKTVLQAFGDFRSVTAAGGIKVLVVIFPEIRFETWDKTWQQYPYQGIHKQVAGLAAKNGFHVLDLYDVYSHSGHEPRDLVLRRSDDHPNRLGHELAARAIAKELLAERHFYFGEE